MISTAIRLNHKNPLNLQPAPMTFGVPFFILHVGLRLPRAKSPRNDASKIKCLQLFAVKIKNN
jgi:hypothetical protein